MIGDQKLPPQIASAAEENSSKQIVADSLV